jgi:tRNA (adenine57-N1/adenine58-N1)-methyltransferase
MSYTIKEGDPLILLDVKGNKILIIANKGNRKIKGLGVYNPGELIGKHYYENIIIGNKKYLILTPSIFDKVSTIERRAQIILPKDGMFIIFYCDIKSEDMVIEGGTGSGALTILLANFVRPKGRVISYEKRVDFAKIALKNLENAALADYVDIKKRDITESIEERNVDAVILDIPNPWDAVKNSFKALKFGGHIASYSPTINQVEKTVNEMRKYEFLDVTTIETLQRKMLVGERGVRPSFDALGHTGYVTFGRKVK